MEKMKSKLNKIQKKHWGGLAVVLIALAIFFARGEDTSPKVYQNESAKISFAYGYNYFLDEIKGEDRESVVITEDTKFNRDVRSGRIVGTEGPISITVDVFSNVPKTGEVISWVGENLEYNFQLSNGKYETGNVGGAKAVFYKIDGLYPAEVVVFRHNDKFVMITGQYNSELDPIREEFNRILETIELK